LYPAPAPAEGGCFGDLSSAEEDQKRSKSKMKIRIRKRIRSRIKSKIRTRDAAESS